MKIYHITTERAWAAARGMGVYRAPSLKDAGFIHCSTAEQVVGVANAFYAGQTGLVLLCIEPSRLHAELRWEPPAHPHPDRAPEVEDGERFPHLYGPLNVDAVDSALPLVQDADNGFSLPAGVA